MPHCNKSFSTNDQYSMILEQKTIKPWFISINSSNKNDFVQSLQNAEQVLRKYNQSTLFGVGGITAFVKSFA